MGNQDCKLGGYAHLHRKEVSKKFKKNDDVSITPR